MVRRERPAYWPEKSQYRRDRNSPDRTRKSQKASLQFRRSSFQWSRYACYSGRRENRRSSKKVEMESRKDSRSEKRQNLFVRWWGSAQESDKLQKISGRCR